MNLTDKGIAEIKSAPRWIEEGIAAFEAMGGKLLGLFSVPGEYDYVALGDLPSDEEVLALVVTFSAKGLLTPLSYRHSPQTPLPV